MAELTEHPLAWAEEHPAMTGVIIFGGGLALLWLFGFFSSSSTTTSSGNSLAAAYYAAEANQASLGAAMQINSENTAAQTAVAGIQANAAVSINAANDSTAQTIAANGYGAQTTIAQAGYAAGTQQAALMYGAQTTQAGYAAQTTQAGYAIAGQTQQVQANDALAASQTSSAYAYQTAVAGNQANELINAMDLVIPGEFQKGNETAVVPGVGNFALGYGGSSPQSLAAAGYDSTQIAQIIGSA